jgi:hypothetical protein
MTLDNPFLTKTNQADATNQQKGPDQTANVTEHGPDKRYQFTKNYHTNDSPSNDSDNP